MLRAGGGLVPQSSYTYDLDGNEISEVVTIAGSNATQDLFHVYDPATDRLIETFTGNSSPGSATTDVHYGYDALGRLASVTTYRINGAATATDTLGSHSMYNASGSITTTNLPNTVYTYDNAGNLHSETLPDGVTQTYGYDTLNRLTSETVTEGSTNIASFSYSLSTDGKRMTETDNQYNTSGTLLYTNSYVWTYDGDNRLTSETLTAGSGAPESSYTDTYQYDSVGNRTQKVHTVGSNVTTIAYSYDTNGDDRLMTETATGTGAYTTQYTYDNNGSLKTETRTGSGATTNSYSYDVQNHLTSATIGNTTTNYAYDADGNRVSSTQGSATTYFTIDDSNPTGYSQIIEVAGSFGGTPTTSYVIGQAVLGQANGSGVLSYLASDGHGSTRILVDANGGITQRYDYDAYGIAQTSTTGTQILYVGEFFDPGIQLYNLRARFYDPNTGRFTSFDTFNGDRFVAKYIYADGNPVNGADPSGHQTEGQIVALGIGLILLAILLPAATLQLQHALGPIHVSMPSFNFSNSSVTTTSHLMTSQEAEDLAGSISNHAQGHFPNMGIDELADRIAEILKGDFDEGYEAADGRAIYIKGDTVVVVNPLDPVDGGTAYPSNDPQGELDKFIKENPTPKTGEGN